MITVICAWCGRWLNSYPSDDGKDAISHGCCPECLAKELAKI